MTEDVNAQPMLLEDRLDGFHVVRAPAVTDFSVEILDAGVRAGSITAVGQDIVIHAANGEFHYRRCPDSDQPALPRTIRFGRVE